jgi:hypothetical protein
MTTTSCRKRRELLRPTLPRLAAVTWIAWLAGIGLMWGLYRGQVMHPHYLPLTVLLAIELLGTLALLFGGLWRLARGPQRARALGWLLLGTTPFWLTAGHISYGVWRIQSRVIPNNWLTKIGGSGGAAILDGLMRYAYPHRLEGRHVVMVYDHSANPAADVAAMDLHIEQLERALDRPCSAKVHWIRGPLVGLQGVYAQGLAIAITSGFEPLIAGKLEMVDRHEAAHFVLEHHRGPDSDPPSLLCEGWAEWAESQSLDEPNILARQVWRMKQRGVTFTLRELTGDDWYARHWDQAYLQGAVLVDYILREHGPTKFMELYTTCRKATFADDCQRILGLDLDELDRRYWSDIETQVRATGDLVDNPFHRVELKDGVDETAWKEFLEQSTVAWAQLQTTYRQVQVEYKATIALHLKTQTEDLWERTALAMNGDQRRVVLETDEGANAVVASPQQSFHLQKKPGDAQWTLVNDGPPNASRLAYAYYRNWYSDISHAAGLLEKLHMARASGFTVTAFERSEEKGESRARIDFEYPSNLDERPNRTRGHVVLLPKAHWALRSLETRMTSPKGDYFERRQVEYGPAHEGIPVVRSMRWEWNNPLGKSPNVKTTLVHRCEFTPAPEEAFTLAAFDVAPLGWRDWLARIQTPWHLLLTWAGSAISPVLGLSILTIAARRRKPRRGPAQEAPSNVVASQVYAIRP